MKVNLKRLKAEIKRMVVNIHPLAKGGEGGFGELIIIKSPLIPLFQRGRPELFYICPKGMTVNSWPCRPAISLR